MNKKYIWKSLLPILFPFLACTENNNNLGNDIKPVQDSIFVAVDTFHLVSSNLFIDSAYLENDTLLLGEIYNERLGTTKADLLFQVAPPLNYVFPTTDSDSIKNAAPDSLVLVFNYKTWFGSKTSPFEIKLYELNKKTLNYASTYFSNINIDDYTDKTILIGNRVMTSIDQSLPLSVVSDSSYMPSIRYLFDGSYALRFFNLPPSAFESQANFLNHFKGIYATTSYGSSTMLHIKQIYLVLFYHYTRIYNDGENTNSKVVNTWVNFPVTSEVRQANRIIHPDKAAIKAKIDAIDSINFIKAPAGIYTEVKIPISRMIKQINQKVGFNKTATINKATLNLQVTDINSKETEPQPSPYLLMVKKNQLTNYFQKDLRPSNDTISVIGYYSSTDKAYSFDMRHFISTYLRVNESDIQKELDMVILPINATYSSVTSSSATYLVLNDVQEYFKIAGMSIRSGKNANSPMRIEVSYSGF